MDLRTNAVFLVILQYTEYACAALGNVAAGT